MATSERQSGKIPFPRNPRSENDRGSLWIADSFAMHKQSQPIPQAFLGPVVRVMRNYYDIANTVPSNERPTETVEMIKRKIVHTLAVVKATDDILQQDPNIPFDRKLALTIALFHDIGRFPQAFVGFDDTVFDHAKVGAVMTQAALPRHPEQPTIDSAIRQHSLPKPATQEPYALLIRHADKLALLREIVKTNHFVKNNDAKHRLKLNPIAQEALLQGKSVLHTDVANDADKALMLLAWANDITFPAVKQIIIREGLLDQVLTQLVTLTGEVNPQVGTYIEEWKKI